MPFGALTASLAMHAGLAYWLLAHPPSAAGTTGTVDDAVSIEFVEASALESVASRPANARAGGSEALASRPGSQAPVDQAEVAAMQPAPARDVEKSPDEAQVKPETGPEPELVAAEIVKSDPLQHPDPVPETERAQREPDRNRSDAGQDLVEQMAQEAKSQGGASVLVAASDNEAAAAANTGAAHYAMLVRVALGSARPKHDGVRGWVSVEFALTERGGVRFARVATSSGNAVLDQAAVSAVGRTTFPTPPAGMSDNDRIYAVRFDFK